MATTTNNTGLGPNATAHAQWQSFFLPEGRACVARRQELGDYIPDPDRAARTYASFAAFDALMKGPAHQQLDLERGRRIGEIMAAQPSGIETRHQVTEEVTTLAA